MRNTIILLLSALFITATPQVFAASPAESVRSTIDKVVEVNVKLSGPANLSQRRAKLREIINPRFDFKEMSKRSLGAHWQEITPEQQEDFVSVFSDLLARTYLSRIEEVTPNMVRVDGETIELPKALVKTQVTSKGEVFPLDYKMINTSGDWRVYDVIIENIGLVTNYRNEFSGILRRDKFEGLMKLLRDKIKNG
jgi:phospholipid transport system substrate-binding protein